jgi:hypothetical protein
MDKHNKAVILLGIKQRYFPDSIFFLQKKPSLTPSLIQNIFSNFYCAPFFIYLANFTRLLFNTVII